MFFKFSELDAVVENSTTRHKLCFECIEVAGDKVKLNRKPISAFIISKGISLFALDFMIGSQ